MNQYQKGHASADIDRLSAKLALAIPEEESVKTSTTKANESIADTDETAEQLCIITVEHSVIHMLEKHTDLAKGQGSFRPKYVVAISLARSQSAHSIHSKTIFTQGDTSRERKDVQC